jgi:small subunit ribosomal protein S21
MENSFGKPVEVEVRDSLEKAMKILKQKMSKEGIPGAQTSSFLQKPSVARNKNERGPQTARREMKRRVMPAAPRGAARVVDRLTGGGGPRRRCRRCR